MARRKKSILVELAAALPWWVGVVGALVAHFILRTIAHELSPDPETQNMGQIAVTSLYGTLATFGQYVVPFLLLLGSLFSVLDRRTRSNLFEKASQQASSVAAMQWREFEMLVGEAFRQLGYRITETPPGPDGGVDIRMTRDKVRYLVQCKHYKSSRVSVSVVRELYGVMAAEGAGGGFVMTSGCFTRDAREFAKRHHIQLIDGQALAAMIQRTKRSASSPVIQKTETTQPGDSPDCPGCGLTMVKRTAKRGSNTGQIFWGCSDYPRCKTTMAFQQ